MKSLFSIVFCIFYIFNYGQVNPNTKWGKVTQEEVDYSQVSFAPEAGAVILYEEGKTRIENSFETKVYRRIKILNEKGLEAANQEFRY